MEFRQNTKLLLSGYLKANENEDKAFKKIV